LLRNLSKFITQTGLYCSEQLETTFHQFCEKPLHITFKRPVNSDKVMCSVVLRDQCLGFIQHPLL